MNFSQTKSIAVAENTKDLEKLRDKLKGFGYWIVAFSAIALSTWMIYTDEQKPPEKKVAATKIHATQSNTAAASVPILSGTLAIPVGGRSELIAAIDEKHADFTGFGKFLPHTVRESDGSECAYGEACYVDGPRLKGYFVTNEDTKEVRVSFQFKDRQ